MATMIRKLLGAIFETVLFGMCHRLWEERRADPVRTVTQEQLEQLSERLRSSLQAGTSRRENVQTRPNIGLQVLGSGD
jgi:hypothetical protein